MNVARMRAVDTWLGTPVCWLLTVWAPADGPARGRARRAAQNPVHQTGRTRFDGARAGTRSRAAVARVGRDHVYFLLFAENRPILDLLDLIPREKRGRDQRPRAGRGRRRARFARCSASDNSASTPSLIWSSSRGRRRRWRTCPARAGGSASTPHTGPAVIAATCSRTGSRSTRTCTPASRSARWSKR